MPAKLPDELRRVPFPVKLPPALIAAVRARAKKLGMSNTAFVERALEAALGNRVGSSAGSGRAITPPVEGRQVGRGAGPEPKPGPASPRALAPADGADRAQAFRAAAARRKG